MFFYIVLKLVYDVYKKLVFLFFFYILFNIEYSFKIKKNFLLNIDV